MKVSVQIRLLAIISLLNGALSFNISSYKCGMEHRKGRVANVEENRWPWMANIRINEGQKLSFQCTGAIIDNQHILTTASCITLDGKQFPTEKIKVRLGSPHAFTDGMPPIHVISAKTDYSYDHKSRRNDLAILTLDGPVEFSRTILPVCLQQVDEDVKDFTVAEWGRNKKNGPIGDRVLTTEAKSIPADRCFRMKATSEAVAAGSDLQSVDWYIKEHNLKPLVETQMCAKGGPDTCSGDAGGLLMYQNTYARWILAGMVSQSWDGCTDSEYSATMYTRVSPHYDFIQRNAPKSVWLEKGY